MVAGEDATGALDVNLVGDPISRYPSGLSRQQLERFTEHASSNTFVPAPR